LYSAASIGHPARSSLIRPTTRRFEIAERVADGWFLDTKCLTFSLRSSKERVVLAAHLSAEGRVPPGAIFREKIEGRWYTM